MSRDTRNGHFENYIVTILICFADDMLGKILVYVFFPVGDKKRINIILVCVVLKKKMGDIGEIICFVLCLDGFTKKYCERKLELIFLSFAILFCCLKIYIKRISRKRFYFCDIFDAYFFQCIGGKCNSLRSLYIDFEIRQKILSDSVPIFA